MSLTPIRTVLIPLLACLLSPSLAPQADGPVVPPTKYFNKVIPGLLEYKMSTETSGAFSAGDPIRIKFTLTNLRAQPIEVCRECVGESIQVNSPSKSMVSCGVMPSPIATTGRKSWLDPHKSVSNVLEISQLECVRTSRGTVELNDSYCFRTKTNGQDIDYCVRAGPISITLDR